MNDGPSNPAPPGACASLSLPRAGDIFGSGESTGSQSFKVIAGKPCPWSARSDAPWITVTAASGSGNGIVRFRLERNPEPQFRIGTITVAG
ncbi:MAG: BACON domain-containing protein, partial [Betaproteobacteria bacterium]